jgi:acyl carrier protein
MADTELIDVDEDIFEAGFGNSMFAMQLVNFVERKFGIEIDSEDLEIDNFRTIGRVAALVERKRMVSGSV